MDGIKYLIRSDTDVSVIKNVEPYSGDISIPAKVVYLSKEYNVVEIENEAFYNCDGLTSIKLGENISSIGASAFSGCTGLTSVELGESLSLIGTSAFSGCTSLTSVEFGENLSSIGASAFSGCTGLTSVEFGNNLSSIGESAFSGCIGLTSVEFGENLSSIGESAFEGCIGLTTVEFGNKLSSLGASAFEGCTGLTSVEFGENLSSIGSSAFSGCTGLTSVVFGESLSSIGSSAFSGCTGLTSVEFGENLSSIGTSAFKGCTGIEALSIPATVTEFGAEAFRGCSNLKSLTFEDGDAPLVFPNGSYVEGSGSQIREKTVNGKDVRYRIRFYNGYFEGRPIEKLYIGRNLSGEKRYTISGSGGVDEYVITLYDGPFGNLSRLSDLTIGENVSVLGPQKVHISEVDLYSTPGSFYYCESIENVKVEAVTPPTGAEFSSSVYSHATLVVPDNTVDDYKVAEGWKDFYNIISESEATSIDNVETVTRAGVKVENGNIVVEDAKGIVSVYTVAGTLVKSVKADGNVKIAVPGSGVYIVKVGGKAVKVAM